MIEFEGERLFYYYLGTRRSNEVPDPKRIYSYNSIIHGTESFFICLWNVLPPLFVNSAERSNQTQGLKMVTNRGSSHFKSAKFLPRKPSPHSITLYIIILFAFSILIFIYFSKDILEDEQTPLLSEESQSEQVCCVFPQFVLNGYNYWQFRELGFDFGLLLNDG